MNPSSSTASAQRPEFITLIAIYQFVTAGILLLLSCLIPTVLFPGLLIAVDGAEGLLASLLLLTGALAILIGFAVASVVVGWGLLRMREWSRLGAIVLAAFALIGFPIWTIVAILVLVYLTSDEARSHFANAGRSDAGDPRYHDALAAQAVYKAEPAGREMSPAEETRRMSGATSPGSTNGGASGSGPSRPEDWTDRPIPMPAPDDDPAAVTESLYDTEDYVSDHYRRWKASLPVSPETKPGERWFVPPEETGMDHRILESLDSEQPEDDEKPDNDRDNR